MTSTQSLRERKTIPTASPGSQQKPRSKSEKLRFFFPQKGASLALGGVEHLIFIFSPQGDALQKVRGTKEHHQFCHPLTSAPAGPMFAGGEWNQRSRGWLAKEKQKLNNVRFIWTQALFCVAYSNCFHFFELVSAKVKTIRLPSKSQ